MGRVGKASPYYPAAMREPDLTAEDSTNDPVTRPPSLWPDSLQRPVRGSAFVSTRFDPAADERAVSEAQAAAAFDVCHPALALRAVLLVQAMLAVTALATADGVAHWMQRQSALAFGGTVAALLWLVLLCAARRPLRRAPAAVRAVAVLLLGAACALAGGAPLWWLELADTAGGLRVAGTAAAGAGVAALLWAWLGWRARIWQPAQAQARLAELQSRIRPHFLFNALNTALALVRTDPERAERVLEDLSDLFRTALADVGAATSLADEIALARAYLEIESVRFGPRLVIDWELDGAADAARVPPLVLQPLVENAVRHGVEPALGGGRVWVRTQARRGQAVITVSNTVPDEPSNPGHGMALANVRERLRLLHDVAADCTTWREAGVFHARIVLPLP